MAKNYTAQELIDIFKLQNAEQPSGVMSDANIVDLLNRTLTRIYHHTSWTWLTKEHRANAVAGELALPSDFFSFVDYNQRMSGKTGSIPSPIWNITKKHTPLFIQRTERFTTLGESGNEDRCYLDMTNNKIVFLQNTVTDEFIMDYVYIPEDISVSETPVLPMGMQPCLPHLMSLEFSIIENETPDRNFDEKNLKTFYDYLTPYVTRDTQLKQYGKNRT